MSVRDIFAANLERIKSLDIETDRLNERDLSTKSGTVQAGRIWSIGLDDADGGRETFVDFLNMKGDSNYRGHFYAAGGDFARQQEARGSFRNFYSHIKTGMASTEDEALDMLRRDTMASSALIIQNHNFENKMLGEAFGRSGMDVSENMRYYQPESNRPFYTPPQITELRHEAAGLHRDFLSSGDDAVFKKSAEAYSQIMKEYGKEMASNKPGSFVLELMDVTKATYSMAAEAGLMDKRMANIGTQVDFLQRHMLNLGEEKHEALDDARRQRQAFHQMLGMQEEIAQGNVSSKTKTLLRGVDRAKQKEAYSQFVRGVANTLEEIDTFGSTRILGQSAAQSTKTISTLQRQADGQSLEIKSAARNYGQQTMTKDWKVAFENVYNRYSEIGHIPGGLEEELDQFSQNADRVSYLKKMSNIENEKEIVSNSRSKAVNWVRKMQAKKKFLAAASAAVVGTIAIDSATQNEQARGDAKRVRERESYKRSVSRLQDPNPYHGSGFADFANQKKSHEY